ncbi:S-protein-like 29, partial [Mucuna pruriens]
MSLFAKSRFLLLVFTLLSTSNAHVKTLESIINDVEGKLDINDRCNSSFFGKTHVSVTNALKQKEDLTIHCKSADDDLGVHLLHFNQAFEWSFRPKLIGNTQFYCSFQWQKYPLVWYDIYIAKRDRYICGL